MADYEDVLLREQRGGNAQLNSHHGRSGTGEYGDQSVMISRETPFLQKHYTIQTT
jgi:hypothetical protein